KWIYAIKPNFDKAFYLKTITLRKSEHFAGYNRGAESGLQRFLPEVSAPAKPKMEEWLSRTKRKN
ncbi:MAG: hypothetical protein J5I98_30925, partial [Phaeodactylibacter sp.]|nr:hypothetical protein [Phaeodactylibacter sp.]